MTTRAKNGYRSGKHWELAGPFLLGQCHDAHDDFHDSYALHHALLMKFFYVLSVHSNLG